MLLHQHKTRLYLPFALERKYPHAGYEWIWQHVFPSDRISKYPRTGVVRRHYLHESSLQKALKQAVRQRVSKNG